MPHRFLIAAIAISFSIATGSAADMPQGFVYLRDVDPTIQQDMRYAGSANFVGHTVPGYDAPECVLVAQAANGLKAVQAELHEKQLSLKVYDCYRPARAVGAFVAWAKEPDDAKAKSVYYPPWKSARCFPTISPRAPAIRAAPQSISHSYRLSRVRRPKRICNRPQQRVHQEERPARRTTASTWARASIVSTVKPTRKRQA